MRLGKKRSMLIAGLLALSFAIATPLALADRQAATPVVPSQCGTGFGSNPIIDVRMQVKNDEDSGFKGYWALDSYQKTIVVWQSATTPTSFCALVQYSGQWHTFKGALSPQNGAAQTGDGSGQMVGGRVATFTGTLTPTKPVTGFIGTYDFGGTKADILAASQTGGSPVSWLTFYFGATSASYTDLTWSWTYTQGDGVGYGNMWVNAASGSFGDILTQSQGEGD